jgi:putative tricarboxylic transport membrane protein
MTDTPDPAPSLLPHEEPLPPRWDLYVAAAFLSLGIAVIAAALAMPTFYERLQQVYTAPGLVPALHGAVIALLSIWLALRAVSRGALKAAPAAPEAPPEGYSNFRLTVAAALCLVYAVGLIGQTPFWLATGLFVLAFILLFEWQTGVSWRSRLRPFLAALAVAAGTALGVTLVFERLFLVRLP